MDLLWFVLIAVAFVWLTLSVVSLVDMLVDMRDPHSAMAGVFADLPDNIAQSRIHTMIVIGVILALTAVTWPVDVVRMFRD